MTCIVGIEYEGDVYIGGDSAGVAGDSISVRSDRKVFSRTFNSERWVFGFTTSFRMGQIIRYRLNLPKAPRKDQYVLEYLAVDFVDALREAYRDAGWAGTDEGRDRSGQFLVAYRGGLYELQSDFQVGKHEDPFASVGCGADLALGALYATEGQDPWKRMSTALHAASRFSAGVCPPYYMMAQGGEMCIATSPSELTLAIGPGSSASINPRRSWVTSHRPAAAASAG